MKYILNSQKTKCKKLFDKVIKEINKDNMCDCHICFQNTNNKSSYNFNYCVEWENNLNKLEINLNKYYEVIKELNNKFYPECSICFEATSHQTICDHLVCLSCESKINKCAICRKDFIKPAPLSFHDVVERIELEYENENGDVFLHRLVGIIELNEIFRLFEFR
jgi:hypothetical protein